MKINEKNLYTFANSKPVDKEGFLYFKREMKFHKRWFVLKGNLLFYFDKKGDSQPLGLLLLEGCTVELTDDEDSQQQYCFSVCFHGENNRTYYMGASSQHEMEIWMKALTCASYDYMKLMVSELQRQLEEIDSRNKGHTSDSAPPKAPPRQRQNPFNKPSSSTTQSLSPSSETTQAELETIRDRDIDMTFETLHQEIGKPIQEKIQRSENLSAVI